MANRSRSAQVTRLRSLSHECKRMVNTLDMSRSSLMLTSMRSRITSARRASGAPLIRISTAATNTIALPVRRRQRRNLEHDSGGEHARVRDLAAVGVGDQAPPRSVVVLLER